MPSGTTPPMTPSGAAAATTMNTIDATPRLPLSLRAGRRRFIPQSIWCGSDFGHEEAILRWKESIGWLDARADARRFSHIWSQRESYYAAAAFTA